MGSSSGSAVAVASGLCPAALGPGAGGSGRQPAANCGIVGVKPTHGLVDSSGALGPPTICDVGPLTRSVEDASVVLDALTGGSYTQTLRGSVGHARVGVPRSHVELAHPDPEISSAFTDALDVIRQLGMEIVEVDIAGLADAAAANFIVLNAEAFASHEEALRTRMGDVGRSAPVYHLQGAFLSAADYIVALKVGAAAGGPLYEKRSTPRLIAPPVA